MPRVAASNGIRPEIRALAVLQLNVPVTPAEINDHVGTGEYAAKYVSFLNTRYGFTITTQKDGRKVVSYTLIAEPANAAALRGATPSTAVAAPAKAKAKATKVAVPRKPKVTAERKVAASVKAPRKVRDYDDVTETFGTSGEIASSFSVDGDWDSFEGVDLKYL